MNKCYLNFEDIDRRIKLVKMKQKIFLCLSFILVVITGFAQSVSMTYTNPVWEGYLADPYAFKASDGYYYAIGTGLKDTYFEYEGELEYENHFPMLKSKDMQNWELVGGVLPDLKEPFIKRYWAPEIAEKDGKYYLFYSGDMRIRVAVADKPEGPYTDLEKILIPDRFNIDGHPFFDPVSKQWYLYIAKKFRFGDRPGTGLAVVKLGEDMASLEGPIHDITTEFRDWQLFGSKNVEYCVEGASVVYKDGKYWCFYSGGDWKTPTYGVGCLVSDSIMGTYRDVWSLERGSVVSTIPGELIGPGHTSLLLAPDNETWFLVYHSWNKERTKRQMCLDPLVWTDKGPKVYQPARGRKTVTIPLDVD